LSRYPRWLRQVCRSLSLSLSLPLSLPLLLPLSLSLSPMCTSHYLVGSN
jgi:hypothetical protein